MPADEVGLETEPFHIKVTCDAIGLEVNIIAADPNDGVMVAGQISKLLKWKLQIKTKVTVVHP